MDTRTKILNPAAAVALAVPAPTVVTGYFDVLSPSYIGDLATLPRPLIVIVLPLAAALLSQRARAELAAALRMVDYVITADDGDPGPLIESLHPARVVRLEGSHLARRRELIEHVNRRHSA